LNSTQWYLPHSNLSIPFPNALEIAGQARNDIVRGMGQATDRCAGADPPE